MKTGLIPENVYERSVLKGLEFYTERYTDGAVVGKYCASFSYKSQETVLISENYNASIRELGGAIAAVGAVNSLIVKGADVKAVNITLLMPEKYSEEKMKKILSNIDESLAHVKVPVSNLAGELVTYVKEPCIIASAIGVAQDEPHKAEVLPDYDVVMIGHAGGAGAAILAEICKSRLLERYSESYIDGAYMKSKDAFVKYKAALAAKSGGTKIFQISKGGVYAALWNLAKECKVGLEIDLKSIPIKQETVEICNYLDLNPYELFSEGCLLVTIKDGQGLVEALLQQNIDAAIIGKTTSSNDKLIVNDYEQKYLTKPCPDELVKYL